MPNYRNANSIFTDEFLPKSDYSKIVYPVDYEKDSKVVYNEINVIKQICDIDRFADFTNSYLIEISDAEIDNEIKFINYNNFRKDKYKLMLIMKQDKVEKIAENDLAKEQIQMVRENIENLRKLNFKIVDNVQEGKVISQIQKAEELDKKIVQQIMTGKIEEAYQEIEQWYQYIEERLRKKETEEKEIFEKYKIEVPKEIKAKMNFVKDGYIDLSFENIFYEGRYVFYDQEWYLENIPLEFILYRAINNLYTYNKEKIEKKIKKEDILDKFKLKEFIPYFEELEQIIQNEILNEEIVSEYKSEINKSYRNIEQLDQNNVRKEKEIYDLLLQHKNLLSQLEQTRKEKEEWKEKYMILESEFKKHLLWRLMRKIRRFFRKGK